MAPSSRRFAARPHLVGLEDRAVPASFAVDSLSETAVAGKLTLREAVATANANGENDTIRLAGVLSGQTVTLTRGEFVLGETGKTLDVVFSAATPPTLNGGQRSRLVSVPAGATVSVSRLALANGKADKGGAVSNAGTLTLEGVTVRDSTASGGGGGIFTDTGSTLTVAGSTVRGNSTAGSGGGLFDFGATRLVVRGSLVADNAAGDIGGGIAAGNLTLVQTTVTNNATTGDGGGVWVNGRLASVNSTVVNNAADFAGAGTFTGGGLFVDAGGTAVLSNTLVAGNVVGTDGANAADDIGGLVDAAGSKNNLVADAATAGGLVDGANGVVGVAGAGTRPLDSIVSAVPAANGSTGPFTLALVAGSAALDAGDEALAVTPGTAVPLAEDGRGVGFARVAGAGVDVGAFEVQNLAPVVTGPTGKISVPEDDPNGVVFAGAGNTVTVTDPFAVSPTYAVTLTGRGGTVTLGTTAGLTDVTGNGTGTVTFKAATLALVNAALDGTKFLAGANRNGPGGFTVTVDDGDTTAPGGAKAGGGSADVTVTGVIDPPSVTSPGTPTNTPVEVVLSRNPADGGEITHFRVTNLVGGTLSYVGPRSVNDTPIQVNNGDVLFFGGSFLTLTPDADTRFLFTPTAGFEGTASFDVQVAQGVYGEPAPGQPNPPPVFGGPVVTSTITVGGVAPPADTTAPTARLTAPDASVAGGTIYTFTVTYTDDVAVDAGTLDGNDVRVTSASGFDQPAQFVSVTPAGNGKSVTATYRLELGAGAYTVTQQAGQVLDAAGNKAAAVALGTFAIIGIIPPPPPLTPTPRLVGYQQFAVGTDRGGDGAVRFFNADNSPRLVDPLRPFGAFTGGVRTAAADFNGDGVADIAVGTGPGRATRVVVIDGVTQQELFAVNPFEATFTGGVFVAAGDVNGDGRAELVVTPDEGGGPVVAVYASTGPQLARFFGIEDPNFRGGARAAVGDLDGDGKADVVVAAGFGGGPRVAGFSGAGLDPAGAPPKLFPDFFAFENTLRNGTFVAAGDTDGDGKAEVIAGGGPGGGPRVSTFSAAELRTGLATGRLADFFAGDVNSRGGVRLAVKNLDGDARADIVAGSGTGAGSRVVGFTGKALAANSRQPAETGGFEAVPGFTGGVFVG